MRIVRHHDLARNHVCFLSMDVGLQPGSSGRSVDVVMAFVYQKDLKKSHINAYYII